MGQSEPLPRGKTDWSKDEHLNQTEPTSRDLEDRITELLDCGWQYFPLFVLRRKKNLVSRENTRSRSEDSCRGEDGKEGLASIPGSVCSEAQLSSCSWILLLIFKKLQLLQEQR